MIPKKIHYIWLGGDKPESVKSCVDSTHKYNSDYEIIEWNESNIDLSVLSECELYFYNRWYATHKYAFCSDLIRLYILRDHGGIYIDTDVEFVKHLDESFLESPFLGRINPEGTPCNGCIWGTTGNDDDFLSLMISKMQDRLLHSGRLYGRKWIFNSIMIGHFRKNGDEPSNEITEMFGYKIYPIDYFCPQNCYTKELNISKNTVSIHHFDLSWKR